jgi:hypothetical protein
LAPDFQTIRLIDAVTDNPVTTQNFEIAGKIFGPDTGTLRGKAIRKKPIPFVDDVIEILKELHTSQYAIRL